MALAATASFYDSIKAICKIYSLGGRVIARSAALTKPDDGDVAPGGGGRGNMCAYPAYTRHRDTVDTLLLLLIRIAIGGMSHVGDGPQLSPAVVVLIVAPSPSPLSSPSPRYHYHLLPFAIAFFSPSSLIPPLLGFERPAAINEIA